MKTNAQLTYERIRFDQPNDLHLLVTLEAPRVEWQSRRPPVCVIPVIDVSGSMEGEKLHFAKESVRKLIDHLAPGDFFGIVTFSTEVVTVAPPTEITQAKRLTLKKAVGALQSEASTNFAGGLLEGLEHANAPHIPESMLRRVIMFTDGLANHGVATSTPDIVKLLEHSRGKATVSAFGYGTDADQDLLRDVSAAGRGNYAFVKGPEDALTAFARELGGLVSVWARDIEVRVCPGAGVKLVDVVSDVDSSRDGDAVRIRIPDLLSEELRQIVVSLRVDAREQPGVAHVVDVEGTYQVLHPERGSFDTARFTRPVEVRLVAHGEEQNAPTREVDEAVGMAEVIRAQIAAEERAARGDFDGSQALLAVLLVSLKQRGHSVAAEACERVIASVADHVAYESGKAFRTSLRKGMSRSTVGMLEPAAEYLVKRSGRKTSNETQEVMANAFAEPTLKPKRSSSSSKPSLNRKRSKRW